MNQAKREGLDKAVLVSKDVRMNQKGGDGKRVWHLYPKLQEEQARTEVLDETDLTTQKNREQSYLALTTPTNLTE